MLAFLPTIPAAPRGEFPPEPAPRDGGSTAAVLVSLIAFCALLAPVGWAAWPRGTGATARRVAGVRMTPTVYVPPSDGCASRPTPATLPVEANSPCLVASPK